MDDYGVSRYLELDDNESLLLASWVRSCFWLHPAVSDVLQVSLLPEEVAPEGDAVPNEGEGGNGAAGQPEPDSNGGGTVTLGLQLAGGKVRTLPMSTSGSIQQGRQRGRGRQREHGQGKGRGRSRGGWVRGCVTWDTAGSLKGSWAAGVGLFMPLC